MEAYIAQAPQHDFIEEVFGTGGDSSEMHRSPGDNDHCPASKNL